MWNDVPPLIISACNHDMERLKKFLSNLNNLFFFPGYSFTISIGPTRNLLLFWFFLSFDFLWFFFQSSATSSLETSFLILAPLAFLCRKVLQSWHVFLFASSNEVNFDCCFKEHGKTPHVLIIIEFISSHCSDNSHIQ